MNREECKMYLMDAIETYKHYFPDDNIIIDSLDMVYPIKLADVTIFTSLEDEIIIQTK